jgi:hypothetical protein
LNFSTSISHQLPALNFLGRLEFQKQHTLINIDEIVTSLQQESEWQKPEVIEESLQQKSYFTFSVRRSKITVGNGGIVASIEGASTLLCNIGDNPNLLGAIKFSAP